MELGRLSVRATIAALVAGGGLSLGIAACGDDEEPATTPVTTETKTVVPTVTQTVAPPLGTSSLSVSLTEFALSPANPTIEPSKLTINAKNNGSVAHSVQVNGPNGAVTLPSPLDPGESGKLTVKLAKPGKYVWFCPIDNHRDMGMKGTITVK
jgi:plastocyanin